MGVSDLIAGFINDVLGESESGAVELQRAELASRFHCVPSQINYVIATRFSPERGYAVESRRGGGGYIRIRKVRMDPRQLIMHTVNTTGNEIDYNSCRALISNVLAAGSIDGHTARVMLAAVSDAALRSVPPQYRNQVRAGIFKQMLIHAQ